MADLGLMGVLMGDLAASSGSLYREISTCALNTCVMRGHEKRLGLAFFARGNPILTCWQDHV